MIKKEKVKHKFSFVKPSRTLDISLPSEQIIKGGDIISWGKGNKFPEFLLSKVNECPTLETLIEGTTDYVFGSGIDFINLPNTFDPEKINQDGDAFSDVIYKCSSDLITFGGFSVQVIYNYFGDISEVSYVDVSNCRLGADHKKIYYAKKWRFGTYNYDVYPAFGYADQDKITEFYFYRGKNPRTNYPVPLYYSAMTAIETEIEIDKFHFNTVINNFNVNAIINFNDGTPEDEEKERIERGIQDKYTGAENAGMPFISWNDNKDHSTTVERLSEDHFDEKYQALAKNTRQKIYTKFRAIPALFGLMTETTGFSKQEFSEAFKLFNTTMAMPKQREIVGVFDDIFGIKNSFEFKPFVINFD